MYKDFGFTIYDLPAGRFTINTIGDFGPAAGYYN
jgi:hypothetical protein